MLLKDMWLLKVGYLSALYLILLSVGLLTIYISVRGACLMP